MINRQHQIWELLCCHYCHLEIRKLGGASKLHRAKSKMNADRVARRLVQSSKAPPDKRFSRTINRLYHILRRRTRTNEDLSRPFLLEDINDALMNVKNGRASGFDAMYPEFLTFSGPRTRLLARFFSNVFQSNRLPRSFKRTKIITLHSRTSLKTARTAIATPVSRIQISRTSHLQPHRANN